MNGIARRDVIVGVVFAAFTAIVPAARAAAERPKVPLVLFVCQAGTVKSAIARELFLKRAHERAIPVSAFSRGIAPANHLSPALARGLAERGIDPARRPVRQLAQRDLDQADLIVLFDALPGNLKVRSARDWTAQPSFNEQFDQAWPWLESHVRAMLDDLSSPQKENAHG